jgi:hypothetical protein
VRTVGEGGKQRCYRWFKERSRVVRLGSVGRLSEVSLLHAESNSGYIVTGIAGKAGLGLTQPFLDCCITRPMS